MIEVFYKTNNNQVDFHADKDLRVELLATSHDGSSKDRLYRLTSYSLFEGDIKDKTNFNDGAVYIERPEALILGQTLQPDRQIEDVDGSMIDYTFTLPEDGAERDTLIGRKIKEQAIAALQAEGLL